MTPVTRIIANPKKAIASINFILFSCLNNHALEQGVGRAVFWHANILPAPYCCYPNADFFCQSRLGQPPPVAHDNYVLFFNHAAFKACWRQSVK